MAVTDKVPTRGAKERVRLSAVVREFIADTITPISAYLSLGQPGRSCLLESVEGTDRIARFSFIGLDYLETASISDDPAMLGSIRELLARYDLHEQDSVFAGGAVCVFGYDAARVLEPIGARHTVDFAFPDARVFVPGTWVVFDHFTHRAKLIGFARDDDERDAVARRLEAYLLRLAMARPSLPQRVAANGAVRASMDEATFLARVAAVKAYIDEGDVYQLQLGIRYSCALSGTPFDLYRHVRTRNPSPYMFFVDDGDVAVLGASPEFLVRLDGATARIRPLAGTRPRGGTVEEDAAIASELLRDEKERAEHVMLVDLARNDLGKVCRTGSVRVEELMRIERYSHVMHIVSSIAGELRTDLDALDLFQAAFPAGTVTGAPKIRAMQLIDQLEPVARGFYAGSVAHINFTGDMDSCIVLRSAAVFDGRAYWQASAGIVADSDPHAEYAEISHKTRIVREVLGIAQ